MKMDDDEETRGAPSVWHTHAHTHTHRLHDREKAEERREHEERETEKGGESTRETGAQRDIKRQEA